MDVAATSTRMARDAWAIFSAFWDFARADVLFQLRDLCLRRVARFQTGSAQTGESILRQSSPLFSFSLGLLIVGRSFRHFALPIGDLVAASARVADGDYSARVAERGPREVRSLARAFNSMAARLQATRRTAPRAARRCDARTSHAARQ